MPAVQSTYLDNMPEAVAGMIANTEPNNLVSKQVESAAIGFGKALKQGTLASQAIAATAAADVFVGISVRDQSVRPGATPDVVPVGDDALVMKRGVIWVVAGAAISAAGVPAYMVVGTAQAGRFTDAAAAGANLVIPRGTFDSTCGAAGDLVKLRLS